MTGKFIVGRGEATELLEPSKEIFNQMPRAITILDRERDFIPTHGSLRRAGLGSGTSVIPRHQRVERRVGLGGQVRDLA